MKWYFRVNQGKIYSLSNCWLPTRGGGCKPQNLCYSLFFSNCPFSKVHKSCVCPFLISTARVLMINILLLVSHLGTRVTDGERWSVEISGLWRTKKECTACPTHTFFTNSPYSQFYSSWLLQAIPPCTLVNDSTLTEIEGRYSIMTIIVGNGCDEPVSNLRWSSLHFASD